MTRKFVLYPLKEVAENFIDPIKKIGIDEIIKLCGDNSKISVI